MSTAAEPQGNPHPHPEKHTRRAPKALRREQLINATIDSLALRGYAATTLADVADGAGLSRGIVNFHFESKEKLLVETLQFLSDEYSANWREADAAVAVEDFNAGTAAFQPVFKRHGRMVPAAFRWPRGARRFYFNKTLD